jgi:hypothetical protein
MEKYRLFKRFYYALFTLTAIIVLGILARSALASDIIIEQPDDGGVWAAFNGGALFYALPDGISGTLLDVQISANSVTFSSGAQPQIECYTDEARTIPCGAEWGDGNGNLSADGGYQTFTLGSSPERLDFTYSGNYPSASLRTFNPSEFYSLELFSNSTHGQFWGTVSQPFYILNGTSADTSTRIIQINSPTNGSTVAGNTPTFSFNYYYNSATTTLDTAGVNIQDVTVSQEIAGPTEAITADGESTFSEPYALTSGHTYLWTPFLASSTNPAVGVQGPSSTFTISTSALATTTVPTVFQPLWDAIQNNPPFGFIFQLRADLQNLNASSTPAVTLDLADFEVNNIFHPLDVGISGLLAFVFARWAFKRATHFEF